MSSVGFQLQSFSRQIQGESEETEENKRRFTIRNTEVQNCLNQNKRISRSLVKSL